MVSYASVCHVTWKQFYAQCCVRNYTSTRLRKKMQTILNKAKRSNLLPSDFSVLEELFDSADCALFRAVLTIPEHVLHPLLPPRKKTGYNLRKRSRHGLMLPEAKSSFLRNNFLVRMLYADVYRHISAFTLLFDVPSLRLSMTSNKESDWLINWLQFDRATTIRGPTLGPGCCTAA